MERGSLHSRSFRCIDFSIFGYMEINEKWLYGPEKFPGFWRKVSLVSGVSVIKRLNLHEFATQGQDLVSAVRFRDGLFYEGFF